MGDMEMLGVKSSPGADSAPVRAARQRRHATRSLRDGDVAGQAERADADRRPVPLTGDEAGDRAAMSAAAGGPIDRVIDLLPPSAPSSAARAAAITSGKCRGADVDGERPVDVRLGVDAERGVRGDARNLVADTQRGLGGLPPDPQKSTHRS
jgi:hypothetical protein